ncbi:LysM peptidoglycan-binding domain-containing protein [Tichowtungia aerotolerans]|uniref:LysM peptidoglycan-binding domain-containing protein n=1 Tax=Tichowtungia aerotolerans TaxID=2697043 RepID=A0A6P1M321_9BACT|nr:LysM peptidoglycan-binding domain-containing protein [Tichowtungia aerotolerans]QHI69239.1 LysM peptidoglycan-binding domain-containing protein [Tichowtungia aerotolerans]
MTTRLLLLFLCSAIIAGCDSTRDAAEKSNPRIQKGLEQAQLKRWDDAIRQFQTALDNHPGFSRPNLELALIYHQQKKDYVQAIYHYERYLEKQPDSDKAPLIADWIRQAKISLVAQVGQSNRGINEEIIRLTRENNLLRKQLEDLQTAAEAPAPSHPAPSSEAETKPDPALAKVAEPKEVKPEPIPPAEKPPARIQTPAPTPETYTVLPGDTLSKIARTVYGDISKWKDIYSANMDKMENENDLKAGQVITIPKP